MKGKNTMIKQFAGASIWSEDLNNLLPFYRDVLGLKVVMESPDFVMLGADSLEAPSLGLGTHSEVHGHNADPSRFMIQLASDDIKVDWKRLKEAGVVFIEDPTGDGYISIATLKDPEGNLVQLIQLSQS